MAGLPSTLRMALELAEDGATLDRIKLAARSKLKLSSCTNALREAYLLGYLLQTRTHHSGSLGHACEYVITEKGLARLAEFRRPREVKLEPEVKPRYDFGPLMTAFGAIKPEPT